MMDMFICDGSKWRESQAQPCKVDLKDPSDTLDIHVAKLQSAMKAEVRTEVSKQMELVRQELRQELAALDTARAESGLYQNGRRSTTSKSLTSIVKGPTGEVHAELELEGSIWDAALFIGFPQVGSAGSLLVVFALVVNIFIQVVFVLIIANSLVKEQFTTRDLEGLTAWRYKVGHDSRFVSGSSGTSLVERVCRQDLTLEMATEQKNMLAVISAYLPETQDSLTDYLKGPVMCLLALCVWTMCVLREISNIWDRLGALWILPTATDRTTVEFIGDNSLELRTLSCSRTAGAVVIAALRLGIAVALLWIGILYLCFTVSIGDLLLNAMALEMVMHMDELVFYVMAPASLKELIGCLEPLRMRPWPRWRGLDMNALGTPAVLGFLLFFFYKTTLMRSIDNLDQARKILCDGNRSFSFSYDGLEMVHIGFHPEFQEDSAYSIHDAVASLATQEAINNLPVSEWRYALVSAAASGDSPSSHFMDQSSLERLTNTVEDIYARRGGTCHDALTEYPFNVSKPPNTNSPLLPLFENQHKAWPVYLARELGVEEVTSCAQVRQYCFYQRGMSHLRMALLRSLCPVTCGCNSLLNGTVMMAPEFGCPEVCLALPVNAKERASVPCTDVETDPADWRYVTALALFDEVARGAPQYNITVAFGNFGCRIILVANMEGMCVRPVDDLMGHIESGDPYQFQVTKRMTMLCPQTCNCGGLDSKTRAVPHDFLCPSACICAWTIEPPIERDVPTNCTVPSFDPQWSGGPLLGSAATDTRCCHLLVRWSELSKELILAAPANTTPVAWDLVYEGMSQAYKSQYTSVRDHICDPCRPQCLQLWINMSATPIDCSNRDPFV